MTVELTPVDTHRTQVRLTHAGFATAGDRDRHRTAWPLVLDQMEQRLTARSRDLRSPV